MGMRAKRQGVPNTPYNCIIKKNASHCRAIASCQRSSGLIR
jgi:hypothetical protein